MRKKRAFIGLLALLVVGGAAAFLVARASRGARVAALSRRLPSPCGGQDSLRRGLLQPGCKSAVRARAFLERLVAEGTPEPEIELRYVARYGPGPTHHLREVGPCSGPADARVVIVEFFDFGCPHCAHTTSVLDAVLRARSAVAVCYRQFPITSLWAYMASAAARAAHRQGKYVEMHHFLFASNAATLPDLLAAGVKIGLDVARYNKDIWDDAVKAEVRADQEEGITAGVTGTPTLFINGRMYEGPLELEDILDWVDEALSLE